MRPVPTSEPTAAPGARGASIPRPPRTPRLRTLRLCARHARAAAVVALLGGTLAACETTPTERARPSRGVPSVGDILRLNTRTSSACDTLTADFRNGRVAAVTERAIVVADQSNPAGGFTDDEYRSFGVAFDTLVYPVDVANFGEPTDLNGDGRVIVFFTSAVNALSERNSETVVGGFFWERDLFPTTGTNSCRGSNDAELFYMLVPDPQGTVNGNVRPKPSVARTTVAVLGHEFQHLINASRRFYISRSTADETTWLNEGLSHVAEELLFNRTSGLAARRNITINEIRSTQRTLDGFNQYQSSNAARFINYLQAPESNSPYRNDDELATRGATWDFLRFAADRLASGNEAQFWNRLVNSSTGGQANLQQVTGLSTAQLAALYNDWAVAALADDLPGANVLATYTKPSWNYRQLLPSLSVGNTPLNRYPLAVRGFGDRSPQTVSLVPGGAAYLRFDAPAGQAVAISVGGSLTTDVRANLVNLATGAVQTVAGAAAATVTAPASATPTQWALVLFNANQTSGGPTLALSLASSGATGPTPSVAALPPEVQASLQAGPTLARLAASEAAPALVVSDAALRARLRPMTAGLLGRLPAARAEYERRQRGESEGAAAW